MSEVYNSLGYQDEKYVVAANKIIRGKQAMSLQTARLIRLLITQIAKHDNELGIYKCKITDLARYLGISRDNIYRDIDSITTEALESVVIISTGESDQAWEKFHWVSTAKYDGEGTVTLQLSNEIKEFVVELDKLFTRYQYRNVLYIKSYYALRLYELIICEDGEKNSVKDTQYRLGKRSVTFKVEKLREWLGCEDKLIQFGHFKTKAIENPIKEINEKTDIYVEPIYHKWGRKVTSIEFVIKPNYANDELPYANDYYEKRREKEQSEDKEEWYDENVKVFEKLTAEEVEEFRKKRYGLE